MIKLYHTSIIKCGLASIFVLTVSACGQVGPKADVYRTCKNAVSEKLKAPKTAEFSSFNDTEITQRINDYIKDDVVRAKWTVSGYVDSQNSFGAHLRSTFTCKFDQRASDIKLVSVSI